MAEESAIWKGVLFVVIAIAIVALVIGSIALSRVTVITTTNGVTITGYLSTAASGYFNFSSAGTSLLMEIWSAAGAGGGSPSSSPITIGSGGGGGCYGSVKLSNASSALFHCGTGGSPTGSGTYTGYGGNTDVTVYFADGNSNFYSLGGGQGGMNMTAPLSLVAGGNGGVPITSNFDLTIPGQDGSPPNWLQTGANFVGGIGGSASNAGLGGSPGASTLYGATTTVVLPSNGSIAAGGGGAGGYSYGGYGGSGLVKFSYWV